MTRVASTAIMMPAMPPPLTPPAKSESERSTVETSDGEEQSAELELHCMGAAFIEIHTKYSVKCSSPLKSDSTNRWKGRRASDSLTDRTRNLASNEI